MIATEALFRSVPSVELLQNAYTELSDRSLTNPDEKKLLAEVCFLLAMRLREQSAPDRERACKLARQALELYSELRIETLDDAAPLLWQHLPDVMHEGVVRGRLGDLLEASN